MKQNSVRNIIGYIDLAEGFDLFAGTTQYISVRDAIHYHLRHRGDTPLPVDIVLHRDPAIDALLEPARKRLFENRREKAQVGTDGWYDRFAETP